MEGIMRCAYEVLHAFEVVAEGTEPEKPAEKKENVDDKKENGEEKQDDETKDPMEELREECTKEEKISKLFDILNECNDRVKSKTNTTETCEQELIDFLHERDHCVSQKLFDKLK